MLTRRITLTIATAILLTLLVGVVAFTVTTNDPTAASPVAPPREPVVTTPDDTVGDGTEPTDDQAEVAESTSTTVDAATDLGEIDDPAEASLAEIDEPAEVTLAAIDAADLYAVHCASCHGTNGEGGSGGSVLNLGLTFDEIVDITANGVPRMPAFSGTLTSDEIDAITEFILALDS